MNMLRMQDRMNTRVHEHWAAQNFEWYRAIWIECGELMDHHGYKWWKRQTPELDQVQLEVIDIWHFGMSALFGDGQTIEDIADSILADINAAPDSPSNILEATEALAQHSLQTKSFSPARFWTLMHASGLDFETLYTAYVGKNVLNFFRQDNGYKDGSYEKNWAGREDNEHLAELVATLDTTAADFSDQVYSALSERYTQLVAQS
jgi:dimeric dUTPase (all-alpha-NTP-PPase superfamily)